MTDQSGFQIFRSGMTNLYLLPHNGEYILIDAGVKKKAVAFLSFLDKQKIVPDAIRFIFLTHTHYDHTGGLHLIHKVTKGQVIVRQEETDYLRHGNTPISPGTRASTKIISFLGHYFFKNIGKFMPVDPEISWEDDVYIVPDGFPASGIHTPGHTAGSATLIWKEKTAFVGDALFGLEKEDCFPWFANDLHALRDTWLKLLDTPCEVFYPSHGKPVTKKILLQSYQKHFGK